MFSRQVRFCLKFSSALDSSVVLAWRPACFCFCATWFVVDGSGEPRAERRQGKGRVRFELQMCHGDDGTGTDAGKSLGVPDLSSDEVQKLSDDMLFDVISNGKNNMPVFKDQLSADEIRAAISHVRTFAAREELDLIAVERLLYIVVRYDPDSVPENDGCATVSTVGLICWARCSPTLSVWGRHAVKQHCERISRFLDHLLQF